MEGRKEERRETQERKRGVGEKEKQRPIKQ